jgi:serine acetyltransferase
VLRADTHLLGRTTVGAASEVGPGAYLRDAFVGDRARVVASHLYECVVGSRCSVGPYAYIRPNTVLAEGAKAGTFVEIKNSQVGEGSKVPHLSYVGDAIIGRDSNVAAGNITANYDGEHKHATQIGDGVRTGSDTTFVAPVTVGDGAYTAAGSVITHDVPPGAGDAEGARRPVVRDHRAGRGVGAVADGDRRHEHGVATDPHVVADDRSVLGDAVVVDEDRGGPDVAALADAGVTHVGQVRHLGSRADRCALDLHEGPHLRAIGEVGAGPQERERTHGGPWPDPVSYTHLTLPTTPYV